MEKPATGTTALAKTEAPAKTDNHRNPDPKISAETGSDVWVEGWADDLGG